jgi:hypothetical protein
LAIAAGVRADDLLADHCTDAETMPSYLHMMSMPLRHGGIAG